MKSSTSTHEVQLLGRTVTFNDKGVERLNEIHPLKHTVLALETALLDCNTGELSLLVELGELKGILHVAHRGGPWSEDFERWEPRWEVLRQRALEALHGR